MIRATRAYPAIPLCESLSTLDGVHPRGLSSST